MKIKRDPGKPDLNKKVFTARVNIHSDILSFVNNPDSVEQEIRDYFDMVSWQFEDEACHYYGFDINLVDFDSAEICSEKSYGHYDWGETGTDYFIKVKWTESDPAYKLRIKKEQAKYDAYQEWYKANKAEIEKEKLSRERKKIEKQAKSWATRFDNLKDKYAQAKSKKKEWEDKLAEFDKENS